MNIVSGSFKKFASSSDIHYIQKATQKSDDTPVNDMNLLKPASGERNIVTH